MRRTDSLHVQFTQCDHGAVDPFGTGINQMHPAKDRVDFLSIGESEDMVERIDQTRVCTTKQYHSALSRPKEQRLIVRDRVWHGAVVVQHEWAPDVFVVGLTGYFSGHEDAGQDFHGPGVFPP